MHGMLCEQAISFAPALHAVDGHALAMTVRSDSNVVTNASRRDLCMTLLVYLTYSATKMNDNVKNATCTFRFLQ